jgi:hypothetical protein
MCPSTHLYSYEESSSCCLTRTTTSTVAGGALRQRGIVPRIGRRGLDASERLGRHRWVAERTLAWLNRYWRLKVRYERLADVH